MAVKQKNVWVDNVKVIACILVVVGHFFQSMTNASILPANDLYQWFIQTIYFFHVQLFFICSGYLYQRYSKVNTAKAWKHNVMKKALALRVPYVTFTIAIWLLKTVFSSSVNAGMETGIIRTLLLEPTSPCWYLYTLFFLFLITPTFNSSKAVVAGIGASLVMELIILIGEGGQHLCNIVHVFLRDLVSHRNVPGIWKLRKGGQKMEYLHWLYTRSRVCRSERCCLPA